MKDVFLRNKKKIIGLIIALLMGFAGFQLSPETQESITNTAAGMLPDAAPEVPAVKTAP